MISYDKHGCAIITVKKEDQLGIELIEDNFNFRVGEAWQQLVAHQFPDLSHMFFITFDGKHLNIDFVDASAEYKQQIVDYIEDQIKKGFRC